MISFMLFSRNSATLSGSCSFAALVALVDCSGHFERAGFAEGVDVCKTDIVEFLVVLIISFCAFTS